MVWEGLGFGLGTRLVADLQQILTEVSGAATVLRSDIFLRIRNFSICKLLSDPNSFTTTARKTKGSFEDYGTPV